MTKMLRLISVGLVLLAAAVTEASAGGSVLRFGAVLRGAPHAAGNGRGALQAELDNESGVLTYTATFSGLSGPPTAAGFRDGVTAPGAFAVSAPINGASKVSGTVSLSPAQVAELNSARFTFQVATSANPDGEIAGKVSRAN